MMSRLLILIALLSLVVPRCGFAADAPPPQQQQRQPNIIYILADDLGYTDLGCYGSGYYETPNIDRLAAQGMRFTDGYTAGPNCQPTRAALLSGQYGPRTGVYTVGSINRFDWQSRPLRPVDNVTALPLDKVTLPQALKRAGYRTAMFGKWHLGPLVGPHAPAARGFDEAIEASGKHFDFKTTPPTDHPKGQYLADFLTDRSLDFIRRNERQPFFLYLAHFGVHAPHQAKPEHVERFRKKPRAGGHDDPTYAAMIYSVDESVGRIMALLDELKLADDTLVVFTSDNGGVGGYDRAGIRRAKGVTDNAPLRGGKGMLYEGGVRVPFVFRLPGKIPAGTTSREPIISVDIYPTLLELARAEPPRAQSGEPYTLDGTSILPHLVHQKPLARDAIYWHFPGYLGAGNNDWRTKPVGAIRSGDFKLLEFFEDGRLELYNLRDDPGEQADLAARQPERAKAMREKLIEWRAAVEAPMPAPIADADKAAAARRPRQRNRGAAAATTGEDEE